MAITTAELNLLAFPQHWDGAALTVRFLCLPQNDPRAPLAAGALAFADADLRFEARLIPSLDHLPRAADAVAVGPLLLDEAPQQKAALFAELAVQFKIVPPDAAPLVAPPAPRFRKPVTASYRSLVGSRQLSAGLASADDYACALHAAHAEQPAAPVVLPDTLRWGEVLAFALRQPKLASALGLLGQARIPLDDPALFARGGWLHIGLHASGDLAADPAWVASHAARLPPLQAGVPRGLYATVLFPVDGAGVADDVFRDAERYDQGFARLVHAAQGGQQGDAIRLAWDDEHLADAFARQVAASANAPMGTAGYRVDVRDLAGDGAGGVADGAADGGAWHSLQQVASIGPLMLGPLTLGPAAGEVAIEVAPVQASPTLVGDFWMPPYFCTWRGASLVLTDADLTRLHQRAGFDPAFDAMRLGREQRFEAVGDKDVALLYGHRYQFRVRLADLSRGGPGPDAATPAATDRDAHHLAELSFMRHKPPGAVQVVQRPSRADLRLIVAKPRLRHPELLFTGAHSFADLDAALDADLLAGRQTEPGLPDPDVLVLHIRLEVRALQGDQAAWWPLYETRRAFDADALTLDLQPVDLPTLDGLAALQPEAGALLVPTARDLRLVLVALGRGDAGYFASDAARQGTAVVVELRAAAQAEAALFAAEPLLRSFFFRAAGGNPAVPRPLARLAQEAGLDARELTLTGRAASRTVLGCASALRHVLSPERASLTLASDTDLAQRWINVLQIALARDWTWDALATDGLAVQRRLSRPGQADVVELAGTITLPRAVAATALPPAGPVGDGARDPQRAFSQLVFIDALDPKPRPGGFPTELSVSYEISAVLRDGVPAPAALQLGVLLPVTTPPVQVPHLVSAGIALSPHLAADDYASTQQRQRMLWLEFDAPPADPQDAYFVRVLACAADPLLTDEVIAETKPEPALPLDAEWLRQVSPGQPRDDNGLHAMQALLQPALSGAQYLIPLPDGLSAASPELLGLFTYEVRLGHAGGRWSTAQGRFGAPLRVAGVQHPPPPLACQAARGSDAVQVRAPFATPVQGGRHVRPRLPKTRLWAVLYARVEQADAGAWRNLMLLRTPLFALGDPQFVRPSDGAAPLLFGEGQFALAQVQQTLQRHGLGPDAALTTLVVEFQTDPDIDDPLGRNLGHARMLRVSPLVPVPPAC